MMLNLYVQQHQWIVITLLAGGALMLLFCLTYSAMWRPRGEEEKSMAVDKKDAKGLVKATLSFIPWVLILLALSSLAFTVIYVLQKTLRTPNW